MNKKDLIQQLSKRCGIKKYKAEECLEAFKEILAEALLDGEKVNMAGFGIFDTVHAKEAMRRNPCTGEPVLMPERIKVRFKANNGKKYYLDSSYRDLRKSLESIIRGNLTLTNNVVIAETTVLKRGKCTCLQSRSYSFNLEEYFKRIKGECNSNRNNQYCRYAG